MKLLILCTGNTCRSPMAEGVVKDLIQKHALEDVKVTSMGFAAYDGQKPTPHAVTAMAEKGIDISKHESRRVMFGDLMEYDHFYVMTLTHKNYLTEAIPELENRITVLDIPDPIHGDLQVYRNCREQITAFFETQLPLWQAETAEQESEQNDEIQEDDRANGASQ